MILKETVGLYINLLIIGRHTLGFLDKLFGNNIVPAIIENSPEPVLLIPLNKADYCNLKKIIIAITSSTNLTSQLF